jgi:O-methyltransferase involved in polyketide biosynthesis
VEDEKIAPTAHYTAYVWHHVGLPHGDLFATPLGRTMFWTFRAATSGLRRAAGVPSMSEYLELRHRWIEAALEEAEPDRIVEIGAGLSRRGVTWAADRRVSYVEVDLPPMIALKKKMIAQRASPDLRERLSGRLTHVSCDVLSTEFANTLAKLLRDAQRPVVIAEGLVVYFSREDRARLLGNIRVALGDRGIFLCSLRVKAASASMESAMKVLRASTSLVTRGRGTRDDFTDDADVRRFFEDAGFSHAEPLAPALVPELAHVHTPTSVWRARP